MTRSPSSRVKQCGNADFLVTNVLGRIRRVTAQQRGAGLVALTAVVAYLPIIASSPGLVGADTKTYLYLDPGRWMGRATSLWDSDLAFGTVTHQTIGYLWPMGPFYWVFEQLGSPDWFAQRIWLGTILFMAGLGVRYMLRTLGWDGSGLLVAMLAYELSPYLLDYSARISVILLPFAGLPWLIGLTVRSVRTGGWRHPALFALVALTIGSVNATSLLLVGMAPALWIVHVTFVERSVRFGDAIRAAARIGVASLGVSLWWIAGLMLQGGYSLPVTRYTETYRVVAEASTAPEILRGLGYWFFYGNDQFGPWIKPSVDYTQGVWLLFVSFGLVVLALLAASLVRWRHRSYFLLLLVVGALTGIGAHPFDSPSLLGRMFSDFTRTDAGLALRSTPRAVPLVVLSTAVLLGALVSSVHRRWPAWSRTFGALVVIGVVLNNPAMWKVRMIEDNLNRPEDIPEYWLQAASRLDELDDGSRVLEVPGSDFASYRWGNTVDPITPGLMDRAYAARELVPFGSAQSAALLTAFDRRFQEDSLDPRSLVPITRLLSIGDVVHRADLTFERFRTPRPIPTAALLDSIPGLDAPEGFGDPVPNRPIPELPMLDEVYLGIDRTLSDPSPVTRYGVPDPLPIIRTSAAASPTILVGDAEGLVDAAGAGLIDPERTIFYAADLVSNPSVAASALSAPASIIVTDSNRKRARRWGTLRENVGYTERAGESPLVYDPTDNRLDVFPDLEDRPGIAVDDTRTVSIDVGPMTVSASAYGNPVTYTNDDRAYFAVDGDPTTAWVVAAFAEPRGEYLRLEYPDVTTISEFTLVQTLAKTNRHVTEVALNADGREVGRFALDADSLTLAGQRIELPQPTTARVWDLVITDVDLSRRATYPGVSPVGFAEVGMGPRPRPVIEQIRTPVAFMNSLGSDLDRHDLSVVLTRERSNPSEPVRGDPERSMTRLVPLPTGRTFSVAGTVRLSAYAPEQTIDSILGRIAGPDGVGMAAWSSGRLPGDLASGASSAFDSDSSTAWTGVFGPQAGQMITIRRDLPVTIQGITIDVVTDAVHSVPSSFRVFADGSPIGDYATGLSVVDSERGTVTTIELPVEATASEITLQALTVDERLTVDWYSHVDHAMPISIAEIRVSDVMRFGPPVDISTDCRDDLISVDGFGVAVRVVGSATAGVGRSGLRLRSCGLVDSGGDMVVATTPGAVTGFDLDQVVMRSPRDLPATVAVAPAVATRRSDTSFIVDLGASTSDRWLILGQSRNDGWRATLGGTDLGPSTTIAGYANGWLIPAGSGVRVYLDWTPQRLVRWMILLSVLAVLASVLLAWRGRTHLWDLGDGPGVDGATQPSIGAFPLFDHAGRIAGSARLAAGVAVIFALFAAVNLPQWMPVAGLLGVVLFASLRWRRFGTAAALGAALSLGVASLYIMVQQRRFRYPPVFVWPQQFERVHILGVVAIMLIAAEYVRSLVSPEGSDSAHDDPETELSESTPD